MKELLTEFLATILNEVGKKRISTSVEDQPPGTVEPTAGGRFRAKQVGTNKVLYWGDKEMALAWARGQKDATGDDGYTVGGQERDADIGSNIPKDLWRKGKEASQLQYDLPRTKQPSEVTSADTDAARRVYPGARSVSVLDTIQEEEIAVIMKELGIPTGEGEVLPADLGAMEPAYNTQSLEGHYSDDNYYERMRSEGHVVRTPQFKMSPEMINELQKRGFPAKYIQLIERSMNVQATGEDPRFSDMIEGVGAGGNASQFGELMSMAMVAMSPDRREEFATMIKQEILESKLFFLKDQFGASKFKELQANPKALTKALKGIGPVADGEWVDSAIGHSAAFDSYMDEMYGEGRWKLEGAAWDRKFDIEQLGLDYANKGFSTDAVFRVQPLTEQGTSEGPAQAVRASLKKDEKVMLFNGGVGEIKNLVRTSYLPPVKRKLYRTLENLYSLLNSKKSEKEKKTALAAVKRLLKIDGDLSYSKAEKLIREEMNRIDVDARESAPPHVRDVLDRVENFSVTQKNSAMEMATDIARDTSLPTNNEDISTALQAAAELHKLKGWSIKDLDAAYKLVKSCSSAKDVEQCIGDKVGRAKDRLSKIGTMAGAVAEQLNKKYKKSFSDHIALAVNLGSDYLGLFSRENPEMLASLMGVLKEKFPMSVVMGGGEMMIINGTHIGARTLQTMFGVQSYDDLQLGLKLIDVDGEVMLAYEAAGGSGEVIIIGVVDCRQKGSGYAAVGFEIKCSDQFVLEAAKSNSENGTTSGANAQTIERIEGRINKRNSKSK